MGRTSNTLVGIATLLCFAAAGEVRAIDIGTSDAYRAQRFEAWGTSLAWWANGVGGWTDTDSRDELISRMFDQSNGLGLNYARYNVGGGQNRLYAGNFRPGALVPGWVPTAPASVTDTSTWQWNWDADPNQRLVLDAVLDSGVNRVDAISYSAPFWMTISQDTAGGPGGASNIASDAIVDAYAQYQSEVVKHFYDNFGVRFQAFSPMNEPSASWWQAGGGQEGMRVEEGYDQRYLLEKTGEALAAKGVPVGISAAEEFAASWTVSAVNQFNSYTESFITQLNTHVYGGSGSNPTSSLNSVRNLADSKGWRLYQSEYGNNSTTGLLGGIGLASRITQDVNIMGVDGWAYWQVVEPTSLSGAGWGLAWAGYNPSDSGYTIRKQYHVMRQFSGHIRPGSHVLTTSDADTVAAYDPATETTVIVFTNDSSASVQKQYDLLDGAPSFARRIHTTNTDDYVSTAFSPGGGTLAVTAEGPSVTTLVLHSRPNLVADAGFDAPATQWQASGDAGFVSDPDEGDVAQLIADNTTHSGAVWQSGIGSATTDLSGVAYQLSADLLFQEALASNYDADTRIALEFYGADGETLAHADVSDFATAITSTTEDSEWRTYRTPTVVAPAGARYVRPVFRFDNVGFSSNEPVFIDNVYLQEVNYTPRGRAWFTDGGGDIADDANWDFDALRSENANLIFGDVIGQPATVTVTADTSASSVTIDSPQPYRLLGAGRLLLSAEPGAEALLDVRRGNHQLLIGMRLDSDATLRALDGASATITGAVDANGHTLAIEGAGEVLLSEGLTQGGGSLELYAKDSASVSLGPQSVLDGSLDILLAPGQDPGAGEVFELVDYSGSVVQFAAVNLPTLASGLDWQIAYGPSSLEATVVAATIPGDYNGDGAVNAADYTVWRDSLGADVPIRSGADGDGDGVIGPNDYAVWQANFGMTASSALAVPEPAMWSLFALAAAIRCAVR